MLIAPHPDFDALPSAEQGRRLGTLARDALKAFGFETRTVRRVREGYCTTFRAADEQGRVIALKVGRVQTETITSLSSECEWAQQLRDCGLSVPPLVRTPDGSSVAIGKEPLAGARPCIAYAWVSGRRRLARITPASAAALGRLTARAHEAAGVFRSASFERKTWGVDYMCGNWSGPDPLETQLAGEDLQLVRTWHERIDGVYHRLPRQPASWGAIVADIGPHNVLWNGQSPWLVDLNDTGWGFYSYDLAILWRTLTDREGSAIESALLNGYCEVRELPAGWGVEMQAAAIIRLLRWRAGRDRVECDRLMGHLRDLS